MSEEIKTEETEEYNTDGFIEFNGLKIDPVIFTQGFVAGCDMRICGGQCCNWGVYLDRDFEPEIRKYEKEIIEVMDEHQVKDSSLWFETEPEEDSDFPSGFAVGTELYENPAGQTQCVFKDKRGFCSVQVMAVENNLHKWIAKPRYCVMYPITIIDEVLTYDDDHSNKLDYCGQTHEENFTQTVFEAMTEEIKYIMGDEGYNFLNEHFKKNYQRKYQIRI